MQSPPAYFTSILTALTLAACSDQLAATRTVDQDLKYHVVDYTFSRRYCVPLADMKANAYLELPSNVEHYKPYDGREEFKVSDRDVIQIFESGSGILALEKEDGAENFVIRLLDCEHLFAVPGSSKVKYVYIKAGGSAGRVVV